MILPSGDNIGLHGRRAQLLPIHPLLFADTLRLDRVRAAPYQLKDFQDLPFRGLSLDSLAQLVELGLRSQSDPELLEVWYFNFPGTKPREWWKTYAGLRGGPDSAALDLLPRPALEDRRRAAFSRGPPLGAE